MAANTSPIFALTPNSVTSIIQAANTARDGSSTLVTIFTAGAFGSIVESITFRSGTATAGAQASMVVRVWVTDTSGANPRFLCEGALTGVTASNTAIGGFLCFNFQTGQVITASASSLLLDITSPIVLASGQLLKATQSVRGATADDNHVFVKGADY